MKGLPSSKNPAKPQDGPHRYVGGLLEVLVCAGSGWKRITRSVCLMEPFERSAKGLCSNEATCSQPQDVAIYIYISIHIYIYIYIPLATPGELNKLMKAL